MKKWIEENLEKRVVIGGDFNVRIGRKGGKWDKYGAREEKRSRDKTINREGKECINWLNDMGLSIANEVEEKNEGDFTYLGPRTHCNRLYNNKCKRR